MIQTTLATAALLLSATDGRAATVKGSVTNVPVAAPSSRPLGYTRARVAAPAQNTKRRGDAVLFLEALNTLPLPPPTAKWPVKLRGLRFEPAIVGCVIDESLEVTNEEAVPLTVMIGDEVVGPIPPGGTKPYKCQRSGSNHARVKEWRHARATVVVGEIGLTIRTDADGHFQVSAPEGSYQLKLITEQGVKLTKPVTVTKSDVDVGSIDAGAAPEKTDAKDPADSIKPAPDPKAPKPGAAAPPKPPPPPPAPVAKPAPAPKPAAPAPAPAKPKSEDEALELEP